MSTETAPADEAAQDRADEVCRDIVLPVSPEEAWALVTDPSHLERWFAPEVDLELHEGGHASFRWDGGQERRGVVEEVRPAERLSFRWRSIGAPVDDGRATPTRVVIDLLPVDGGTRLTVREQGFAGVVAAAAVPGCVLVSRWVWETRLAACLRLLVPVAA